MEIISWKVTVNFLALKLADKPESKDSRKAVFTRHGCDHP